MLKKKHSNNGNTDSRCVFEPVELTTNAEFTFSFFFSVLSTGTNFSLFCLSHLPFAVLSNIAPPIRTNFQFACLDSLGAGQPWRRSALAPVSLGAG
jgi:hypothetical protein